MPVRGRGQTPQLRLCDTENREICIYVPAQAFSASLKIFTHVTRYPSRGGPLLSSGKWRSTEVDVAAAEATAAAEAAEAARAAVVVAVLPPVGAAARAAALAAVPAAAAAVRPRAARAPAARR